MSEFDNIMKTQLDAIRRNLDKFDIQHKENRETFDREIRKLMKDFRKMNKESILKTYCINCKHELDLESDADPQRFIYGCENLECNVNKIIITWESA